MKKYAQIIDEKLMLVDVGLGTDNEYYKSIGMVEMEVEQAWNNNWYVKGYAPSKPEEVDKQEKIVKLQKYLDETDWYVTRFVDNGTPIPEDVKTNRQKAREEINKLRG